MKVKVVFLQDKERYLVILPFHCSGWTYNLSVHQCFQTLLGMDHSVPCCSDSLVLWLVLDFLISNDKPTPSVKSSAPLLLHCATSFYKSLILPLPSLSLFPLTLPYPRFGCAIFEYIQIHPFGSSELFCLQHFAPCGSLLFAALSVDLLFAPCSSYTLRLSKRSSPASQLGFSHVQSCFPYQGCCVGSCSPALCSCFDSAVPFAFLGVECLASCLWA